MKAFDTSKMWKRMEKSNKRVNKRMLQVLKHFFKKDDAGTLKESLLHFRDLMDSTTSLYYTDTDLIMLKPKKWRKLKKQINEYFGARGAGKGANNG